MTAALPRAVLFLLVTVPPLLAGCGDDGAALRRETERTDRLVAELEKAQKDLDGLTQKLGTARNDTRALQDEVAALKDRVAAVEARPAPSGPAAPADPAGAAAPKKPADDRADRLAEVKALQTKVFDGTATEDEQQRFWELVRTTGVIDDTMKALEAKVKDAPDDVGMRMQLADAYISKLLTIPPGPEQGLWSGKAEQQWQAVLKKDPEHWDARYSVAFNWSMWPDFLNKTPDAVREFEKLREIQERHAPEAKHAQTYLQLARLYQKQGKQEKAKETLRAGLARHPEDAELKKASDALAE